MRLYDDGRWEKVSVNRQGKSGQFVIMGRKDIHVAIAQDVGLLFLVTLLIWTGPVFFLTRPEIGFSLLVLNHSQFIDIDGWPPILHTTLPLPICSLSCKSLAYPN